MVPRLLVRAIAKVRGYPTVESVRGAGVVVGEGVWIGRNCSIDFTEPSLLSIGRDSILAPGAVILTHDASMKLSTGFTRVAAVSVGERVFVGYRATVLPGVTIGDGAVVGAGALVRDDVPAGAIVAGNPARVVGQTRDFARRHDELRAANPDRYNATITGARTGPELE